MKSPGGNNTVEDAIVIEEDESPVPMIEDELVDMINVNMNEPSSTSRPPQSKGEVRPLPHSHRVLSASTWFTNEGIVSEQLRIPFSVQIEGLDYLSAKISFMEYVMELWKVVPHLISRSSHEELIQLPELLLRTAVNLTVFRVPEAYKLKGIMEELSQMVGEILKLEGLILPLLNLSVGPLLDFYSDQPSIFGYAEGLLEKVKEGEYTALGGISL
ncbi:hypothetical protein AMTRI_Chr08g164400 [Amborella trichopoda]